jgi:hypothetical protein
MQQTAADLMPPLAAAGAWPFVAEAISGIFGVPLAVVIASLAGAFLAKHKTELPPWKAVLRSLLWAFVGCVVAQGVAGIIMAMSSASPPTPVSPGLLGFLAMLASGLGPKAWPLLYELVPVVVRSLVGRIAPEANPPKDKPTDGGSDATPR